MYYLYKITNLINNKIYIGQTVDPYQRWAQHKSAAKYQTGSQTVTRAITKYGHESFSFEVIATCKTLDDVNFLENVTINQYDSLNRDIGYNINIGGNSAPKPSGFGPKISKILKKYYEENESVRKGAVLPQEWRDNISKGSMGKPGTNNGKEFSEEHKLKMSKSMVGKKHLSQRKFSSEIELEICRLYIEEKLSTDKLAAKYDCGKSLILAILVRNDVPRRAGFSKGKPRKFSEEIELKIVNSYLNENISCSALARKYNCGNTTLRDILIRNGVKF